MFKSGPNVGSERSSLFQSVSSAKRGGGEEEGGEGGAQLFVGFCLPRASNFACPVPPNQPVHLNTEEVNPDEWLLKKLNNAVTVEKGYWV